MGNWQPEPDAPGANPLEPPRNNKSPGSLNKYNDNVPGFDIILSIARMGLGNAKEEAYYAVKHQIIRLRNDYQERDGFEYQVEKLNKILEEGPHKTVQLVRS